jgi:hypothetical protein
MLKAVNWAVLSERGFSAGTPALVRSGMGEEKQNNISLIGNYDASIFEGSAIIAGNGRFRFVAEPRYKYFNDRFQYSFDAHIKQALVPVPFFRKRKLRFLSQCTRRRNI